MSLGTETRPETETARSGGTAGFLFCFKKCSACTAETDTLTNLMIGKLVDVLTWSDLIHVEIVPVTRFAEGEIAVGRYSYTAFMNLGFVRYDAAQCCDRPMFTFLFLPLDEFATRHGIAYLECLVGTEYNKGGLLAAFCHQFMHPKRTQALQFHRKPVFCSEAGLMLCYLVGVYDGPTMPQYCTPKDLYTILREKNAVPISSLKQHA